MAIDFSCRPATLLRSRSATVQRGHGMSDRRETTAKRCRVAHGADTVYGCSLRRLARELSLPLDDVTANGEVATARQPVQTPAATVEAGALGRVPARSGLPDYGYAIRAQREKATVQPQWCSSRRRRPPLHRSARIGLAHNNGGPIAVSALTILEGPGANGE
jgi:hypothetical protein